MNIFLHCTQLVSQGDPARAKVSLARFLSGVQGIAIIRTVTPTRCTPYLGSLPDYLQQIDLKEFCY
jgi:hypothetical protein